MTYEPFELLAYPYADDFDTEEGVDSSDNSLLAGLDNEQETSANEQA